MIHSKLVFVALFFQVINFSVAAISLDEKDQILDLHNSIRESHANTPALTWNNALAKKSQQFVESCQYRDRSNSMDLYEEFSAVDNVAKGYSNWNNVIKAWYAGSKDYDYNNPGYTKQAGSFITMLWKDSTEIGCSSFKCTKGDTTLYQCLYSPSIPFESLLDEKEYKLNVLSTSSS
jgi:hypothetical protein